MLLPRRSRDSDGSSNGLIMVCNQKMSEDINKDLTFIIEQLQEIMGNIEVKKELSRPKVGGKRQLVSECGPRAEEGIREYMEDRMDKMFGIR